MLSKCLLRLQPEALKLFVGKDNWRGRANSLSYWLKVVGMVIYLKSFSTKHIFQMLN